MASWWRTGGRWFALGAVAGVVVTAAVAVVVTGTTSPPGDLEKGELLILSGRDQSRTGERELLLQQWNGMHPESPARIETLSDEADKQRAEMVARAQSGRGAVDVFNLDVTWTAEFAEAGYIQELSDVDTSGFLVKPLAGCRYQKKLWALPFNSDTGLLFHNNELVPEPPTSLSQLKTVAEDVLAADGSVANGSTVGGAGRFIGAYAGQFAPGHESFTINAMEVMWAMDGALIDEDARLTDDWTAASKAVKWLSDALTPSAPGAQSVVAQESRTFDETATNQAFREGKVPMMRAWPVVYRDLADTPDSPGVKRQPFSVARLPGPSALGGQNLAVAANTDQSRAARALIEFLTSPRSQQLLFERGGFAATREIVYGDGVLTGKYPYAKVLKKAIEDAKLRPVTPNYYRVSAVFRDGIDQALRNGGVLPEDLRQRLEDALAGK